MNDQFLLVHTTFPDRESADRIAKTLVEEKLAACVSVNESPSISTYSWQGKIETSREFACQLKTTKDVFEKLRNRLVELHPYEIPELVATPIIDGSADYLAWLETVTGN